MANSKMTPTQTHIVNALATFAQNIVIHDLVRGSGYKVEMDIYNWDRFDYTTHTLNTDKPLARKVTWWVKSKKDADNLKITHGETYLNEQEIESIALANTQGFVFCHNFGYGIDPQERLNADNQAIMQARAMGWMNYQFERLTWIKTSHKMLEMGTAKFA